MRMSREVVGDVVLVNDAYNANPRSMEAAIRELASRPSEGRRVAVLGDMLELGESSLQHHEALGRKAANAGLDCLWAVGPHAEAVAREALRLGMAEENVAWHASTEEALEDMPFEPQPGETWLFKASRGLALERVVECVRQTAHSTSGAYTVGRLGGPRA